MKEPGIPYCDNSKMYFLENIFKEVSMKKMLAFLALGFVLFGSCSAQNAGAQTVNVEQRIIGTWVNNERGEVRGVFNEDDGTWIETVMEQTWVFNADGTLTGIQIGGDDVECKFGVADTKLAIYYDFRDSYYGERYAALVIYSVSISSDGRSLILEIAPTASSGRLESRYWFTKR
jgi:hypothetical protein